MPLWSLLQDMLYLHWEIQQLLLPAFTSKIPHSGACYISFNLTIVYFFTTFMTKILCGPHINYFVTARTKSLDSHFYFRNTAYAIVARVRDTGNINDLIPIPIKTSAFSEDETWCSEVKMV
jgi:hypothetical protein